MNCKNSQCTYRDRCRLCSVAGAPPLERGERSPEPKAAAVPGPGNSRFFVTLERPGGWIGHLSIHGIVENSVSRLLAEVESQLHTLDGLFLKFNSPGGSFFGGECLERLILLSKSQGVGVVCFVIQAQSTCAIPATAGHLSFIHPAGNFGGFGNIIFACDGCEIVPFVSAGTPAKYNGAPPPWAPRTYIESQEDRIRLQSLVDRQDREDLKLIARYIGREPDELRPALDGRTLSAEETVNAGFVATACDEETAFGALLRLIVNSKKEREKNMKISEIFGKSTKKGSSQLDQLLDAVIKIEAKRDNAKAAMESARKTLQQGMAADIAGGSDRDHEALTAAVMDAQERFNAVEALLKQSRDEAVGMIAASADKDRKRLGECEEKIAETRAAIDTRTIQIIAEFTKAHGFNVSWPTKGNAGTVTLPSLSLEGAEIAEIADGVKAARHRDRQTAQLDALYAEKTRLNVVAFSTPNQALDHYLMERRRK